MWRGDAQPPGGSRSDWSPRPADSSPKKPLRPGPPPTERPLECTRFDDLVGDPECANPINRNALLPVTVVHRHDFIFQKRIQHGRVDMVLVFRIRLAIANGPAAGNLERLIEPSV